MAVYQAVVEGSDRVHLVVSGQAGTLCGKDEYTLPAAASELEPCKTCSSKAAKVPAEATTVTTSEGGGQVTPTTPEGQAQKETTK